MVSAKRTPFGTFGGKLKNLSATELSAVACSAALQSGGVRPELVDSVVIGNVAQVRERPVTAAELLGLLVDSPQNGQALTALRPLQFDALCLSCMYLICV